MQDEDILIDWSRPLYINFVHSLISDELIRLYNGIGIVERVLGDVWSYKNIKNIENIENFEDESVPAESQVRIFFSSFFSKLKHSKI